MRRLPLVQGAGRDAEQRAGSTADQQERRLFGRAVPQMARPADRGAWRPGRRIAFPLSSTGGSRSPKSGGYREARDIAALNAEGLLHLSDRFETNSPAR